MSAPGPTILDVMAHPELLGPWFEPASSWAAWRAFLAALFGLPLDGEALDLYRRHTRREKRIAGQFREAWLVVGRRGGKSRIAATVAVYLATFRDYSRILAPGERGTVMLLAADRRQARVLLRYVDGVLSGVAAFASLVESRTTESIHLTNRISIEVHTASFRAVRGYTLVAAICDEVAFWRSDESSNPDSEIINGLRPGMATVPGSLLLAISSPYARKGELWNAHRRHFGKDDSPVLVWQADTRSMNPAVPESVIAEAYADDAASAAAEYGAEFRTDVESFAAREVVEAAVCPGRHELPAIDRIAYEAFVDPAGGSGQDSFTLAIAHREHRGDSEVVVLDAVRERAPKPTFRPSDVIEEYAALLASYRVSRVVGDRYAGEFPREQFRKHGIEYGLAEKPKSDLYRDFLPLLNSGRVELLDHPKLVAQLCGLERRTARGGRDSIDHAPKAHDDLANVVAGVAGLGTGSVEASIRFYERLTAW